MSTDVHVLTLGCKLALYSLKSDNTFSIYHLAFKVKTLVLSVVLLVIH